MVNIKPFKGTRPFNEEAKSLIAPSTDHLSIENIECDCICVSGFWTPSIHLASQSGNKSEFSEKIDAFVPNKSKQKENTIGSANGLFTLEETIKDAFDKGFNVSNKITEKNNRASNICLYIASPNFASWVA